MFWFWFCSWEKLREVQKSLTGKNQERVQAVAELAPKLAKFKAAEKEANRAQEELNK